MRLRRAWLIALGVSTLCTAEAAGQGVGFRRAEYTVGAGPRAVAVADFNGDGKLDLAVANSGGNTVSILLGVGDGTFGAKTDFATGIGPSGIVAEDLNGDGKLDLATANFTDNKVSILLGNGDGTFGTKTDFATGTNPEGIAAGDFNGDGKMDLVTGNFHGNDASILLGQGGGVFGPNVNYATGNGPGPVVVGDFNGDGKLDVAALAESGVVSLLLGNGDGTFGPKTDFTVGTLPLSFAKSDFNGDAKLDLVTANSDLRISFASILLGKGDGTFDPRTDLGTDTEPIAVTAADFNADGKDDFLTANTGYFYYLYYGQRIPGGFSPSASLRLGNGDGTFGGLFNFPLASVPAGMAVGDFNADGRIDVAIASRDNNTVSVLLQSAAVTQDTGFLSFGSNVGSTSAPKAVTLSSTGSFPVTVSSATVTGTDAAEFSISSDNCSGNSIPSGSSCTTSVVFAPTAPGNKAASLVIAHNAPSNPVTVSLAGTGIGSAPTPQFAPSSLSFGSVRVGQTSGSSVTLTNFGTATLNITSVTPTGTNASEFLLNDRCAGTSLGTNSTCQIDVTFKPASAGAKSAAVTVATNAAGSPQTVPLTGTGFVLPPGVGPLPPSVNFGPQLVNTTSAAQSVTLTNTGDETLTISSIALGGANAADFSSSNNCGSSVNGGASCTITLTFKPTASGSRAATLSISSNASGSPHTAGLSGEGSDFSIGPASGSSTTATVSPGGSASFTLSFGALNGFSGTLGLSCSTSSLEVSCTVPASVLVPNNVTVNVTTTMRAFAPLPGQRLERAGLAIERTLLVCMAALLLLGAMLRIRMARSKEMGFRLRTAAAFGGFFLCVLLWSGCAGGSATPPAPRNYTVTVSASSSDVVHTTNLTVVVR